MDGVRKSLPALGFTVGMAAPFPGKRLCLGALGRGVGAKGQKKSIKQKGKKEKEGDFFFFCM